MERPNVERKGDWPVEFRGVAWLLWGLMIGGALLAGLCLLLYCYS